MQFKVPQNIDLEDKIVGPLTLIQFLYLLGGGILDYILLITLGANFIFWILSIPITIFALSMSFLKIQDQPLAHFIVAGIYYLTHPRIRVWQRTDQPEIIKAAPKKKKVEVMPEKRRIERSQLEQLAYVLDTQSPPPAEAKNFGKITEKFEEIIAREKPQGGKVVSVGQKK